MLYFTSAALLVISFLFRHDLGLKALLAYWGAWAIGLAVILGFALSPGYFIAFQAMLAIAMLIQLRINPQI